MRTPPEDRRFTAVIHLPFGPMGIVCNDQDVQEFIFLPPETPEQAPENALAERCAHALAAWITAPDAPHHLPLAASGTPFQRRVWHGISAIPRGQTRSYGELAALLGSAPRAVGGACGANPFPLLVPCHRVLSRSGIGGFAGHTGGYLLDVKQWLLAHEAH